MAKPIRSPPPDFTPFQLAKLVKAAPSGPRWVHEVKFDGYRMQVCVHDWRAQCFTRNGLDWTSKFPVLATVASELPDCLIDGELCALNEAGYSDFPALRSGGEVRQATLCSGPSTVSTSPALAIFAARRSRFAKLPCAPCWTGPRKWSAVSSAGSSRSAMSGPGVAQWSA
jgi:hypothetical protein